MSLLPRPNLGNVGKYALDTLGGFKSFILRGNVVDLAVGIVIGAAFTSVVNSLVSNVITPLIPVPQNSLAGLKWPVPWGGPKVQVDLSSFINAVISFLIVAAVLYFFIVRPFSALMEHYKPQKVVPTRECPYCLQTIPEQATRCSFCTSVLRTEISSGRELYSQETLDILSDKLTDRVIQAAMLRLERQANFAGKSLPPEP